MTKYHRTSLPDTGTLTLELDRNELEKLLHQELHGFALRAGTMVVTELLEAHVSELCGRSHERRKERRGYRYGSQQGYIVLNGQKVRIARPRVRSLDNHTEIELSLYRLLQQRDVLPDQVAGRVIKGVSCRNYVAVVETLLDSIGVSRSSISRSVVHATERKLKELQMRRFPRTRFPVIFIDGVVFKRQTLIAVVGIREDGTKVILAVREGATENATVCVDLFEELRERGLRTDQTTLFVVDGSKALTAAIRRVWGDKALIQRCRAHKLRNVDAYLPKQHRTEILTRIRSAYAEPDYAKAKKELQATVRRLEQIAPAAAASLAEGLEETLTVARLQIPQKLRRGLATTNVVENVFSRVRTICGRVKRWKPGMRLRWCSAALLEAEKTFKRLWGAQHLPALVSALDRIDRKEDKAA